MSEKQKLIYGEVAFKLDVNLKRRGSKLYLFEDESVDVAQQLNPVAIKNGQTT